MNNVVFLKIKELIEFSDQPFKVIDDQSMTELAQSIKDVGVLVPIIVRRIENGKYEIISGHRRKRACEIAGISEIPSIIMELDDDEAAIMLVDSNLQREYILPSERAFAYKLKLEAIKHQGIKDNNSTCGTDVHKSRDDVAQYGESGRQVHRYIRLTELIFQLLDKVDEGIIPVTAGAELSYLDTKNQAKVNDYIESEVCGVSIKKAKLIRDSYTNDNLDEDSLNKIFAEEEKEEKFYLDYTRLKSYFPKEYTMKECEEALWKILGEITKINEI